MGWGGQWVVGEGWGFQFGSLVIKPGTCGAGEVGGLLANNISATKT